MDNSKEFRKENRMAKKKVEKSRSVYRKPVFIKEKSLSFPREIMEQFNGSRFCVQCSGCHSCGSGGD